MIIKINKPAMIDNKENIIIDMYQSCRNNFQQYCYTVRDEDVDHTVTIKEDIKNINIPEIWKCTCKQLYCQHMQAVENYQG